MNKFFKGPSPRAWGKLLESAVVPRDDGTIPTGVGKTGGRRRGLQGRGDHPHGRGENSRRPLLGCPLGGPSPRAWGKQPFRTPIQVDGGTIPTGVGKTWSTTSTHGTGRDHPHGRGENHITAVRSRSIAGPSPRAWGKPSQVRWPCRCPRTIPTGVGKTFGSSGDKSRYSDHPHGRGENERMPDCPSKTRGPSPRAWGKLLHKRPFSRASGTIPTGVGKTTKLTTTAAGGTDHPHGRGENKMMVTSFTTTVGPSPRAWGKLCYNIGTRQEDRTIPTGVGKTFPGHGR